MERKGKQLPELQPLEQRLEKIPWRSRGTACLGTDTPFIALGLLVKESLDPLKVENGDSDEVRFHYFVLSTLPCMFY